MSIYLLSNRHLEASPATTIIHDLEDILVETCGAKLLLPEPRPVKAWDLKVDSEFSFSVARAVRRVVGDFRPLSVNFEPKSAQSEPRVLMIFSLNGLQLDLLSALPNCRKDFDLIVAYVLDCWVVDSFPEVTQYIDHLFIPYPELVGLVESGIQKPVSVLPIAFDVLRQGSGQGDRAIDVISYGRTPQSYHDGLFRKMQQADPPLFYFRNTPEAGQPLPNKPYGIDRFDYQHRLRLNCLLRNSKLALTFENRYTTQLAKQLNEPFHVTHLLTDSILTTRWFECASSGCVVVGKRPQSSLMAQYFDWPDATIELPDDPEAGIEIIQALLRQPDRLNQIHQRNYLECLIRNDWRLRLKTLFETVGLPLSSHLSRGIEELHHRYQLGQIDHRTPAETIL